VRLWAFIALMLVTVVTVVVAAEIAERWFAPGFERGIVIAVIAGLVVFPLTRWFEHKGWVKGAWRPGASGGIEPDPTPADAARPEAAAPMAQNPPSPRPHPSPAVPGPEAAAGRARGHAAAPEVQEQRSQPGDAR
jgi:hypothetical protein